MPSGTDQRLQLPPPRGGRHAGQEMRTHWRPHRVLDGVRESGKVRDDELATVVGRISFFVNSGVRFVEETCKMRAFTQMWDRICAERYGVTDRSSAASATASR